MADRKNIKWINGRVMITRFFIVEADQTKGFKSNLVPDNDFLPLAELQSKIVAELKDGRKIIHATIPPYLIREMKEHIGMTDPLSAEGVAALGISGKFAGRTRSDVIANFPELKGTKVIGQDEKGKDILAPKIKIHTWSGEE